MKKIKEKSIEILGTNISYYDEGSTENKTILCLHGFAESKERYLKLMHKLDPYFRIIALDFPGHGASDQYDMPRVDRYVKLTHQFAKTLNLKEFHLVGFSMGGLISLVFTNEYPDLVDELVIWASSADFSGMKRYKLIRPMFKFLQKNTRIRDSIYFIATSKPGKTVTSALFGSLMVESLEKSDPGTLCEIGDEISRNDFRKKVNHIDKNTLVIIGSSIDVMVAKRKIEEVAELLPNSELKEVTSAQHYSRDESLVIEEILFFLNRGEG